MNKWLVIATRPRWEKKVHNSLMQKGIESYCPLNKVIRRWSDRMKMVEEPLFKSYVFVKITDSERPVVRMTAGVVNFVYAKGKPAALKDKQIQALKQFVEAYSDIEVSTYDTNNTDATVMGMLKHKHPSVKRKHAKIQINGCSYILSAEEKVQLANSIEY